MKPKLCKDCEVPLRVLNRPRCYKCTLEKAKLRRKKKREKKAQTPTAQKKVMDKLWRSKCIEYYGDACQICGDRTRTNLHHIIGRRNLAVRWYVPNGVPLCSKHHVYDIKSAHQDPVWFRDQMIQYRGVGWEKDLREQSNEIFDKDYGGVKNYLEAL